MMPSLFPWKNVILMEFGCSGQKPVVTDGNQEDHTDGFPDRALDSW